jgi:hypothetical protein
METAAGCVEGLTMLYKGVVVEVVPMLVGKMMKV